MMALLALGMAEEKAAVSTSDACLDLCWRRGSQCWYWHYSGMDDMYPESKCNNIFSTCSSECTQNRALIAEKMGQAGSVPVKTSAEVLP